MTHNDKISALMAAINDNIVLPDDEKKVISSALVEGFIRILEVEEAEKKAQQPHTYFPVEFFPGEGFCFWCSGGWSASSGKGESLISVGIGGSHTRILRARQEVNGRHQLVTVYPGCYIGHGKVTGTLDNPCIQIYQIIGFSRSENGYQAKCRKVLQTISDLDPEMQQRFGILLNTCRSVAMSQNARSIVWREE